MGQQTGLQGRKMCIRDRYNGSYKVWFDAATNAGKPVINRIVKYNAVAVTGKVDTKATGVSGYGVLFENQTNGVQLNAQVNADGTYTAYLLSLIHIL